MLLILYACLCLLGMNYLSSNCVVINCYDKTISIAKQLMTIDSSVSNSIVSVVACLNSLIEGAQGYILLCFAKVEAENDVLAISIVCEFQYVFPKEVSSLPPNRDVEFGIVMQSYPARALDGRLQEDWARDAREDPRVLMSLRVDFGPMG